MLRRRKVLQRMASLGAGCLGCVGFAVPVAAKERKKKAQATIAGTVFRDPGFALRGAEVILEPAPEGATSVKVKKMRAVSDGRGEFAFYVPADAMRYQLTVQALGLQPEKRYITIAGEERQDVFVTLKPAN